MPQIWTPQIWTPRKFKIVWHWAAQSGQSLLFISQLNTMYYSKLIFLSTVYLITYMYNTLYNTLYNTCIIHV